MRALVFLTTVLGLLAACTQEVPPSKLHFNALDLARPVVLNGDSTQVVPQDYNMQVDPFYLLEKPSTTLSHLTLAAGNNSIDVPVIIGEKKAFDFTVAGFEGASLKVKGAFNNWNTGASKLAWDGSAWSCRLFLAPGIYEYKLVANGVEVDDPNNPNAVSNGMGGTNNVLTVEGGNEAPEALAFISANGRTLTFSGCSDQQEVMAFWNNTAIAVQQSTASVTVEIPAEATRYSRSWIRLYTAKGGKTGQDWLIPLNGDEVVKETAALDRQDWHTSIMYFMMLDRFEDGNPENNYVVPDSAIHPRANYYGGDLKGVQNKIEEGYFEDLGTNAIWISPITLNPYGAWGWWDQGGPTSKFSGYHGYWPVSNIKPDPRWATEQEIHDFLEQAHKRDNNVLLDYVANHVHQEHPVYQNHPDWATPLYLPDGRENTQLWDEQRLTTWFDSFMPTLELRDSTVAALMSDSALVWITQYAFDGIRHDATKHIPLSFQRLLTRKIKDAKPNAHVYQIGETYGSDELISSYVGNGMLDAQFNFNLYDAAFEAFGGEDVPFDRLKQALESSLKYYGYHHTMGNISGNQDKPRFASWASGDLKPGEDSKLAGWTREIPPANARGFRMLACFHAFNMSIPGIPIIYYGDEIGSYGGNDPDNRKMMRFTNLSEEELALRNTVSQLCHMRQEQMALNYGSTEVLQPEPHLLVIVRTYLDQTTTFLFNNSTEDIHYQDITVPAESYVVH